MTDQTTAYWSVVRGESPFARAVEPGIAGVEIPDEILAWAQHHGLDEKNPDVYLLVTPEDEAGEVLGEIAYMTSGLAAGDIARIREQLGADA